MIYCMNHRTKEADFHCSRCEIGLCKDCVNLRAYDRGKMAVCPVCKNPLTSLEPYKPVAPFWTRIPEIFLYPIRNEAYMYLLGWSVFGLVLLWLSNHAIYAGCLGFVVGIWIRIVYYSLLVSYFYRIVSKTEEGKFWVPEFTEYEGIGTSLMAPVFNFFVACISVFWPLGMLHTLLLVFHWGDWPNYFMAMASPPLIVLQGLLFLFGLLVLPMNLLIIGVFRSFRTVLHPLFIYQQIQKIKEEYAIALGLIVGLLIAYAIIKLILRLLLMTIGGFVTSILSYLLDSALQLYLFMVLGHLLGYMAYQTRFKLKWWPETQGEPEFMIGGRPMRMDKKAPLFNREARKQSAASAAAGSAVAASALLAGLPGGPLGNAAPGPSPLTGAGPGPLAPGPLDEETQKVAEGMHLYNDGRDDEATALFNEVYAKDPKNSGALRGLILCGLRKPDRAAIEFGRQEAVILARQKQYAKLWENFSEFKKVFNDFAFNPREQYQVAGWLNQQKMYMDSARLLREVAVAFPNDPLAPKALFQCGELLRTQCGKPENAKQIFEYILKKYPDLLFADQIQQALDELKPKT